jgi:hypothetical protein
MMVYISVGTVSLCTIMVHFLFMILASILLYWRDLLFARIIKAIPAKAVDTHVRIRHRIGSTCSSRTLKYGNGYLFAGRVAVSPSTAASSLLPNCSLSMRGLF